MKDTESNHYKLHANYFFKKVQGNDHKDTKPDSERSYYQMKRQPTE